MKHEMIQNDVSQPKPTQPNPTLQSIIHTTSLRTFTLRQWAVNMKALEEASTSSNHVPSLLSPHQVLPAVPLAVFRFSSQPLSLRIEVSSRSAFPRVTSH